MENNPNTLYLVMVLAKLTSAVADIDALAESKKYKYQIKKELNAWQSWIENYTKDSLIKLTEADEEVLLEVINRFNEIDERLVLEDRFKAGINIILAKAHSALKDIDSMNPPYSNYVGSMRKKLIQLIHLKVLRIYVNEEIIKELIVETNKIGNRIISS